MGGFFFEYCKPFEYAVFIKSAPLFHGQRCCEKRNG